MNAMTKFKPEVSFQTPAACVPLLAPQSKLALYEDYDERIQALKKRKQETDAFIQVIERTNNFPHAYSLRLATTGALTAEVAAMPIVQSGLFLTQDLKERFLKMATSFRSTLAEMRESCRIGQADWLEQHVCRYCWFERTMTASREVRGNTIHHKNTTFLKGTIHDLVDAIAFPYQEYAGHVPVRVQPLLKAVPQWLSKSVKIIDGTMIREQIVETPVDVQEWTEPVPNPIHTPDAPNTRIWLYSFTPRKDEARSPIARKAGPRNHHDYSIREAADL